MDQMKRCTGCGQEKPITEFGKRKDNKSGIGARCKDCLSIDNKEWYKLNKDKANASSKKWALDNPERNIARRKRWKLDNPEATRRSRLNRMYGITSEKYDQLLSDQAGGCAVCGMTPEQNKKALAVDHDHACCPGKRSCGKCVRGLLCNSCNHLLGQARDSVEVLADAIVYLLDWENNELDRRQL